MAQDSFIVWLNDAYQMEHSIAEALEEHEKDAVGHPELRQKIIEHIAQSKGHAEKIKSCIERRGGQVSGFRSAMSALTGKIRGVSSKGDDTVIRNLLMEYATEYLELGTYKTLIVAAQQLDDRETAEICQQIFEEDREMAKWLDTNLPRYVEDFVSKKDEKTSQDIVGEAIDNVE
jgi:ferritin-like metal-binding protein YciE